MNSFIIRIYRSEQDKPHRMVGVVEEGGVKGKKAFHTYDELWEILNSPNEERPDKKLKKIEEKSSNL